MSTKKVALITGATSGIGKELAKCFAMNGYEVIIVAEDSSKLEKTADEFRKQYGAEVIAIQADLSAPAAAERVYGALGAKRVDVLVNNAGFAAYGPFAENNIDYMISSIRVNVESLTYLTRLILPDMLDRRYGKILNVASTAAFQPGPRMAVFSATKAYVLSFSEALRCELRGTGVSVTTLCPGPMPSSFHNKSGFGSSKLVKSLGLTGTDDVARLAYMRLMDNWSIVIPGFKNRLGVYLAKILPRKMMTRLMARLNTPR